MIHLLPTLPRLLRRFALPVAVLVAAAIASPGQSLAQDPLPDAAPLEDPFGGTLEGSSSADPAGNLGIRMLKPTFPEDTFDLPDGEIEDGGLPAAIVPFAPPDVATPQPGLDLRLTPAPTRVALTARLTEDGSPIRSGVVWRVFAAEPDPDGRLPMVTSSTGGNASFEVEPGVYLVYCGFGYAATTVRIEVKEGGLVEEAVTLNAGGLRLRAATDDTRLLDAEHVRFDVLSLDTDPRGERKVIARDIKPGDLVRLAADTYHVVSRYGDVNAQTRADLEVKPGKLTEVTLFQRAAEVTLKLVGTPGGEAIADTNWSVLTPGGDIVTEGVGAFPSFVLAAGGYTVVARHGSKIYQREFEVETGRDAEVEVLAEEQPIGLR